MLIKYLVLGVADLAPVILLIGRVPAISLDPQGLQQTAHALQTRSWIDSKVNSQRCVKISLIILDLGLNFINAYGCEIRD